MLVIYKHLLRKNLINCEAMFAARGDLTLNYPVLRGFYTIIKTDKRVRVYRSYFADFAGSFNSVRWI